MNKTIKIIDLLNMSANGQEMPKKIRYDGYIWEIGADINLAITYRNNIEKDLFNEYFDMNLIESLNDEVEIIEESEQDIDIQEIEEISEQSEFGRNVKDTRAVRINELVRAVKQLDNKIKEK